MYILRCFDTEKTIVYNVQCGNIDEVVTLLNILKTIEFFILEGIFRNDNVVYTDYDKFRREYGTRES